MAIVAFIFLIVFVSVYLEVLFGSIGIIIPVTAVSIFYISTTYGWKPGIITGIISGTVIDMLYGRPFLITPYCMIFTVAASQIWLHKGDPAASLPNLIPGAISALIVAFPLLLINSYFKEAYLHNLYLLIFGVFCGALMLPIIISILDFVAQKQGFPLYRKARARAMDRK